MSLGVLLSDQWLLSLLQDRPFNQHNAIMLQAEGMRSVAFYTLISIL